MGDAVRSRGERRQSAWRLKSFPWQHLGAVRRRVHGQLHGQPGRLYDHQGGLRQTVRHTGLEGIYQGGGGGYSRWGEGGGGGTRPYFVRGAPTQDKNTILNIK